MDIVNIIESEWYTRSIFGLRERKCPPKEKYKILTAYSLVEGRSSPLAQSTTEKIKEHFGSPRFMDLNRLISFHPFRLADEDPFFPLLFTITFPTLLPSTLRMALG